MIPGWFDIETKPPAGCKREQAVVWLVPMRARRVTVGYCRGEAPDFTLSFHLHALLFSGW